MPNFYFTFGQDHRDRHGRFLKDYWVRVVAPEGATARELFIEEYAKQKLPKPSQWGFQYSEKNFSPLFFPLGEIEVITYKKGEDE